MRLPKFDNASVIETLKQAGCKVGIRHLRKEIAIGFDLVPRFSLDQKGGSTEVVIFADDNQFKGVAKNPKNQQYNKNFGVHVALQRAIKAMNKANDVVDCESSTMSIADKEYESLEQWAEASKL